MKQRLSLGVRIFGLLLILPLLGIAFSPPLKTNAACVSPTDSPIRVNDGLVSAIDVGNISPLTNVNCVSGGSASIPQFSLPTYDSMMRDYFDQAKSSYNKITVSGPAVQDSTDANPDPINLVSF
ncbi:MAG: hypothetical protein PHQ59_00225 [Candidatus Daviesbacteria bacterium]|nr:hypothetical protein [Candidatus Daviesbacteria bacterium]